MTASQPLYPLAELSPAELARVAAFDAAPEPAEVVESREKVERVAQAILRAVLGDTDGGLVLDGDLPASEIARLIHEEAAAAAIAALPVSPAEEALRRVEALADLHTDRYRESYVAVDDLRAALAAPLAGQHTTDEAGPK